MDRYDNLSVPLKLLIILICTAGMGVAVYVIFGFVVGGYIFLDAAYYYLLYAAYGSCMFLILPARKKDNNKIPFYDFVLAGLTLGISVYFFANAFEIINVGWVNPSPLNFAMGLIFALLILEGARRETGYAFPVLTLVIGLYPLVADYFPGILEGVPRSVNEVVGSYAFGGSGLIGLPTHVIGNILFGFLVFAGFLIAAGGGEIFIDFSRAVMGRYRGGPAKVAILASGFLGSLSGSVMSNIAATGSVTIPAMKRSGYPPHYAAAIEACASTGGMIMPPIMGAVAFVMSAFLDISYATVMLAAVIPALLYYYGLIMQVDVYSAKQGLKGLSIEEIPPFWQTIKRAWIIFIVLAFLIWGLIYMRWDAMTPFYAVLLLIVVSFFNRDMMMTPRKFVNALALVGRLLTKITAVLAPMGIIISALTMTGVSSSLTSAIIGLGGDNVFIIIALGVLSCYIMGMAGLITPAYIFLAVSYAPALAKVAGLNVIAIHLSIIYYASVAVITLPVASAAFMAASMAGARPFKTGFMAMRLAAVIYFVPIFFLFNPALIGQGSVINSLFWLALALIGIALLAMGIEGFIYKVGRVGIVSRIIMVAGGILFAFPEKRTTTLGAVLVLLTVAATKLLKMRRHILEKTTLQM